MNISITPIFRFTSQFFERYIATDLAYMGSKIYIWHS